MTDLVITPGNVVAGSNAEKTLGTAGATITAGQVVYRDSSTKKFALADADSATANVREVFGIALNGAANNQPLVVQTSGDINLGATLVVGEVYVASDTPGGIMPKSDAEAGDYMTVLGVASTASNLKMDINAAGAPVA